MYKPSFVKLLINSKFITPIYKISEKLFKLEKNEFYTLYKSGESNKKLLVLFVGGAFLFSQLNTIYGFMNELYEQMKNDSYDLVVFKYPTRFSHTIKETMLHINAVLMKLINRYDIYHGIGISAGALLLGAFIQKETSLHNRDKMEIPQIGIKFRSYTGICGIYNSLFEEKSIMSFLFNNYIFRGTPGIRSYNCRNINIPKLIISCRSDFLYSQTKAFVESETCENEIFADLTLPHAFPQIINLKESQETIKRIADFIKNVDSSMWI